MKTRTRKERRRLFLVEKEVEAIAGLVTNAGLDDSRKFGDGMSYWSEV